MGASLVGRPGRSRCSPDGQMDGRQEIPAPVRLTPRRAPGRWGTRPRVTTVTGTATRRNRVARATRWPEAPPPSSQGGTARHVPVAESGLRGCQRPKKAPYTHTRTRVHTHARARTHTGWTVLRGQRPAGDRRGFEGPASSPPAGGPPGRLSDPESVPPSQKPGPEGETRGPRWAPWAGWRWVVAAAPMGGGALSLRGAGGAEARHSHDPCPAL